MREVVIVDCVRTGLAKSFRGKFNLTRADDMAAALINELLRRNPAVDPAEVEDVIIGCSSHSGEQDGNIGRMAAVLSDLPVSAAGLSINRFCSSGLQSIALAAHHIASGFAEVAIAGGAESISMAARQTAAKADLNKRLLADKPAVYMAMGKTAEVVAERYGVSREAQDLYALQSQQRYARAQESGLIDEEIIPLSVEMKRQKAGAEEDEIVQTTVDRDDCNRPDTTLEGLASLKGAFLDGGSVTAGNSSQLSDGASLALVMSAERAAALGLRPLGVFRGITVAGCEPDEMGIGPVFSVPKLLSRAGVRLEDIDLWELNEAFASQCLYCRDALGIDNEIYNVNGGAIAIGHPFGMSGARMTGHLLRELRRRKKRLGIVTMCVGAGQGVSALFEAA